MSNLNYKSLIKFIGHQASQISYLQGELSTKDSIISELESQVTFYPKYTKTIIIKFNYNLRLINFIFGAVH